MRALIELFAWAFKLERQTAGGRDLTFSQHDAANAVTGTKRA